MKLCLGILCSISAAWASDVSTARIRDAATKAVALIQSSQKSWPSKASCYSCHQQVLPALAFRAAREHGIPVDEPAAHANAANAFGLMPISTGPFSTRTSSTRPWMTPTA